MPTTKINEEMLEEFFGLVKSGLSQEKAAKQLGCIKESMRKAAARLDVPWDCYKPTVKALLEDRIDEILSSDKTQAEWAKELGTSQPLIHRAFKELGIHAMKNQVGIHKSNKVLNARKVIEYILANGGDVPNACRELNIKTPPQYIRDFAAQIGFDLNNYRWAWQEYGNWLTLPGPVVRAKIKSNITAPAICQKCSNIKPLALNNARSGRTQGCQACAVGSGRCFRVRNTETEEVHRSINAFVRSIGNTGRYQQVRVELITKGQYIYRDVKYELIIED